jgi:hypothetical protein
MNRIPVAEFLHDQVKKGACLQETANRALMVMETLCRLYGVDEPQAGCFDDPGDPSANCIALHFDDLNHGVGIEVFDVGPVEVFWSHQFPEPNYGLVEYGSVQEFLEAMNQGTESWTWVLEAMA